MEKKSKRIKTKKLIKESVAKTKGAKPKSEDASHEGFSIPIYNIKGKEVGNFAFDKKIFDGTVNKAALYQAILMYNANKRQGNASTKTRGDVSGGGKKPFRQKGTGRARAGSTRSPLWRGGGSIFGPHTRDFHHWIPKKIKRLAFLSSVNSKLNENRVKGIDAVSLEEPKTKKFKDIMKALKLDGKSLFIVESIENNVKLASRNLEEAKVKNYKDFNTIDVLTCDNIVMSKTAMEKLPERFRDPAPSKEGRARKEGAV
jgi:large subunit ribosomal protein L4